ncbi:MAG: heteropolysaccharide repeat-containing protein [Microgenomates group bacterium LiPW_16]|nr:MAG: heteropolysaccharide repeat-containing protein [Microgenomates group bacterium LiPW_16]
MNLSRVIAYNTLVQILGKSITLVFGITTTALLTNYLGPVGFGDYIFALSFVAIFSGVADWGTVLITVREAAREEKIQDKIFGNILLLRLGLSFLAMAVVWLIIFFFPLTGPHPDFLRRLVILSSVLILLFALKTSLGIIFQTKLKMERGALVDLTASLLTFIFSLIIIKTGGELFSIIGAIILANIVAIMVAFSLTRSLVALDFSLSLAVLRKIFFEALPMGGVLALFSIYNRVDVLILQAIKGSETVGIYGVSYRVYEVLTLAAFYLMNTLLPIISREKSRARLCQIYQKTLDVLILAGGMALVGTIIFAPLAIKVITWQRFGEFAQSVPALRILGLAVLMAYLNHITGYMIVVLGKQRGYFFIALAALIFNVSLNLLLIPVFSLFGAAWTTFLTEGLVFCLTSLFLAKTLRFFPSFFSFPKTGWELVSRKGKIF